MTIKSTNDTTNTPAKPLSERATDALHKGQEAVQKAGHSIAEGATKAGHAMKEAAQRAGHAASEVATPTGAEGVAQKVGNAASEATLKACLLYTSPSPRDRTRSRMPSSA